MTLIPHKQETLVLPITAERVINRLSRVTQPVGLIAPRPENSSISFNGIISNSKFKISRKLHYPQNYLPVINGRVEGSSRGCILFLSYNLFFSSLMFFSFWTIMTVVIGVFFILWPQEYFYAALSFSAGVFNYLVTVLNFNKQVNLSRQALDEALKIAA